MLGNYIISASDVVFRIETAILERAIPASCRKTDSWTFPCAIVMMYKYLGAEG